METILAGSLMFSLFSTFVHLPESDTETAMRERLLKYIEENELLPPGTKTLIAASGGLDSTVLCHLFHEAGLEFGVAHCNFQLRAADSDGDEVFVKALAERWDVPFFSTKFETEKIAKNRGISIQMAARDLRYEWLRETAQAKGFQKVATAHHLNDSIETALYNFAKGCGIRGLHGILPATEGLIRPLLFATRRELLEYARNNDINYREDASNRSDKYARNKLRHQVVPVLEELNPAFLKSAGDTIQRLRQVEEVYNLFFENLRAEVFTTHGQAIFMDKKLLRFPATQSTVLYELLRPYGFNSSQAAQASERMWDSPGALFYSPTHQLLIDREALILKPAGTQILVEIPVGTDLKSVRVQEGEFRFTLRDSGPARFPDDPNTAWLDYDRLVFPLRLRHWRAGDAFQPLGMEGKHQKLQDFFNNRKLSRFAKDRVWILESKGDICWVAGMRLDERFKILPATKRVLEASFIPATFANDNIDY
ncbi:MAG: tRNA lysidine(34) synthetase TilS [Saprospiraceae bacterium]